ncbi:hypothetical protein N9R79_06490 [Vibrio sp.]|nr:hypothetical protein [Vibrio sp.]
MARISGEQIMMNAKLIHHLALKSTHLPFVMSPDEYRHQMLKVHRIESCYAALPPMLLQMVKAKNASSPLAVIEYITPLLRKGEWIAIGTFPRQSKVNANDEHFSPGFYRRITALEETAQPATSAAYATLADDVVLAPPEEPVRDSEETHDHKIVVELAGKNESVNTEVVLSKTPTQYRKSIQPKQDFSQVHRSLASFEGLRNEPRNIYLAIKMNTIAKVMELPLVKNVMPGASGEKRKEWEHVLIPIRVLGYRDKQNQSTTATEFQSGYLYVFWGNTLWRELKILDNGHYSDVDLAYYRYQAKVQKDPTLVREAEGYPVAQVWVPFKLNGQPLPKGNGIQTFFSPKALDITRIEQLEQNSAELARIATPLDGLESYTKIQSYDQEHVLPSKSVVITPTQSHDMPWLTDQTWSLDGVRSEHTPALLVNSHNDCVFFRFDAGSVEDHTNKSLQVMHSSGYESTLTLEKSHMEGQDWFVTPVFDFPEGGSVDVLLIDITTKESIVLYKDLTYDDLFYHEPLPQDETDSPLASASQDHDTTTEFLDIYGRW